MLAYLSRGHDVVAGVAARTIDAAETEEVAVEAKLKFAHGHKQSHLCLFFEAQIQLLLGPPLEEWVDNLMEDLCHLALMLQLLLLSPLEAVGFLLDLAEELLVVKEVRHDEVEQAPEFLQVVVQGSSGEQKPKSGG